MFNAVIYHITSIRFLYLFLFILFSRLRLGQQLRLYGLHAWRFLKLLVIIIFVLLYLILSTFNVEGGGLGRVILSF